MWEYKYGFFLDKQIEEIRVYMQKQIYFLLLYVDKKTCEKYKDVDVNKAFESILTWFDGLNEILFYPTELVKVIALLEEAKKEYNKSDFEFKKYRKLILEAGSEVLNIKEVKNAIT